MVLLIKVLSFLQYEIIVLLAHLQINNIRLSKIVWENYYVCTFPTAHKLFIEQLFFHCSFLKKLKHFRVNKQFQDCFLVIDR